MKNIDVNGIPFAILSKKELPEISEMHRFISGIIIGKKLYCLLEFRKYNEKNKVIAVNTPSFICYDQEKKDDNIGKPISKRDFDELLAMFFTKKQIRKINDAIYPDFPKSGKSKKKK